MSRPITLHLTTRSRAAYARLQAARAVLAVARKCFLAYPSDVTRAAVIDAEVELEDAKAVASEWGVA